MGNLVTKTPYSEVTATLELLDRLGVDREGLKKFRKASLYVRSEVARLMQEGEVSEPTRSWREEDGVIYFSVKSDGTTGKEWIKRLIGKGFRVGDDAKQVFRTPSFKPTSGVTIEVAILKGMLFEDNDRITKKIRAEGALRKFSKPNAEVSCLIREKFTDKEIEAMGLWYIVVMHELINDSGLLRAGRGGEGHWLGAYGGGPDCGWDRDDGFAFAVSSS